MRKMWIWFVFSSVVWAAAQPYVLDTEHYSVPIHERQHHIAEPSSDGPETEFVPDYDPPDVVIAPKQPSSASVPNCSTWRDTPENIRLRLWSTRKRPDEYPEPVDVTVLAVQVYDHYKERYRKVKRVESWVYRRAYYQHIIHCNRARYTSFDVTLYDLEKGDRFETRVTWDDGSHRTLDRTLGANPQLDFYIDEPGYLEY
jgi:hypothetical protein